MADNTREAKLRQMNAAQSYDPERRAFIQGYQEFFPYYQTKEKLPKGMYVGQIEIMQDGRWYRICQSHEPNLSGKDYGLQPGYATYFGGPEFSVANTATEKQIPSFSASDKQILLTNMSVAYKKGDFANGYLRVTGGDIGLGTVMWIAGNEASVDTPNNAGHYDLLLSLRTPMPFGADTSESADRTGFIITANKFSCQRRTVDVASTRYDRPRFYVGTPLVNVPYKHYYWACVGGPSVGIAQADIDNTRMGSNLILTPWTGTSADDGTDAGKLIVKAGNSQQAYAQIDVRTETNFDADAYLPIIIYPK